MTTRGKVGGGRGLVTLYKEPKVYSCGKRKMTDEEREYYSSIQARPRESYATHVISAY